MIQLTNSIVYRCQKYHNTIQYHDFKIIIKMLINDLFGCIHQEMVKEINPSYAHCLVLGIKLKNQVC